MSLAQRLHDLAARVAVEIRDRPAPFGVAASEAALDFGQLTGAQAFSNEAVYRRIDFARGGGRYDLGVINA